MAKRLKHGMSNPNKKQYSIYRAWKSMKSRCLNPNDKNFTLYGGRGIKIHPLWIDDFEDFYSHIGDKPSPNHSLDRFPENNGDYIPNNIRWATQVQQMQNVRKNVVLSLGNKTMVMAQWARLLGVKHESIRNHLKKGRTIEQIAAHYKYKKDNNITKQIPFRFFD